MSQRWIKKQNKLTQSFMLALSGIGWAIAKERNMKIHLVFVVLVVSSSLALGVTPVEVALLSVAVFMVLALELVNTALEQTVDLAVDGKIHSGAKIAKDVAAGAVLLASVNAVIIGIIIFAPKLLSLIK